MLIGLALLILTPGANESENSDGKKTGKLKYFSGVRKPSVFKSRGLAFVHPPLYPHTSDIEISTSGLNYIGTRQHYSHSIFEQFTNIFGGHRDGFLSL